MQTNGFKLNFFFHMKCNGKHLNFMFTLNKNDLQHAYFYNCVFYAFYSIKQKSIKGR